MMSSRLFLLSRFRPPPAASDRALVERYAATGDDEAFAALVDRHGPLVLGVCRRAVRDAHLAEDAFQATFLLLARKAGSLRNADALGNWLFGVARRVAANARRRSRRAAGLAPAVPPAAVADGRDEPGRSPELDDLLHLLDEELARLPDKYRSPLVACYLQARTQDEAAKTLGWSVSTLRRRLDRGRELLRARLTSRGAALGAGLLAGTAPPAVAAAVPPGLFRRTLELAADARGGGPIAAHLLDLTKEGFRMTAKTWVLGVAAAGVVATSVVIGLATGPAPSPPETAKESAPALATAEEPKPAAQPAPAGGPAKWVTLKGRVVYPANRPLPEKKKIDAKSDREHCLSKGDLFADDVVVNPANRGIKNVWVYLRPDSDDPAARLGPAAVHPDLRAAKPVEHAVDQPCCQFVPRVLAVRAGDTIRFKNSSPIPHNVNYAADANPFNRTLPAGGQTTTVVEAQRGTIVFKCDIHPWMAGAVLAFDHPYFALTDADGNYEIKNAPTAGVRVVYRHEGGYHKGRDGAKGFPIAAPAAGGVVQLPPLAFEWPKP